MDPTNNPMQNLNSAPNGGMAPEAGMGMGMGMGMGGPTMANNPGMAMGMNGASVDNGTMVIPGMNGGMSSGNTGMPGANAGMPGVGVGAGVMGGGPSVSNAPGAAMGGVPPMQPAGGQMSPGQMFQAGGVAAPMGALGAIPGDYSSANSPLLGATDPITMPDRPKAPDPVEMELNAPFKAAAPVPGSIGSAISMPGDPNQVPNVAFNDPAMMAPNASMMPKKRTWSSRLGMDGGKKMDKKTMIILGAIVAVVVVAIVAVVIIAL